MRSPLAGRACALALCVCLAAGCGGKSDVRGKVTYRGRALAWGTVTLVDATGQYHQAPIATGGDYQIPGVPPGPVKIGVYSPDPDGPRGRALHQRGDFPGKLRGLVLEDPRAKFRKEATAEPPRPGRGKWFALSAQYTDPEKSGLKGEVRKGQPLDIDIR